MPLFDRDSHQHPGTPGDAPRDASAASGSSSDAESSAAHIAELVRRTTERQSRPGPSSVARPVATAVQPPMPAPPVTQRVAQGVTPPAAPPAEPVTEKSRAAMRLPSIRTLVAVGAVAVVLIAGGVALLSRDGSPGTGSTSATARSSAPAGYAVKATDVITDCASHSYGRTKGSFENQNCVKATRSLATGRVSGRQTLFVVSRIQMASVDTAASVKQVLDANKTGNLNDLLREGRTFPGAPVRMPSSGYASVQSGKVIVVAEAGFVDGGASSNTTPALRAAAAQVAALVTSQS